jgi:hypothetical protein
LLREGRGLALSHRRDAGLTADFPAASRCAEKVPVFCANADQMRGAFHGVVRQGVFSLVYLDYPRPVILQRQKRRAGKQRLDAAKEIMPLTENRTPALPGIARRPTGSRKENPLAFPAP